MALKLGSLFSGCDGLGLGLERELGAEVIWHAEKDKSASKILKSRWPAAKNHGDVSTVDWSKLEPVDILCGGPPCQPFSVAGSKLGVLDERWMWPAFARAVRVLRPPIVIVENVARLLVDGDAFGRIIGDLAESGYCVRWRCLRASDFGAAHFRERVFIVGIAADADRQRLQELCLPLPDGAQQRLTGRGRSQIDWGVYQEAATRWEDIHGPAPTPADADGRIEPNFVAWVMGFPPGWCDVGVSRAAQLVCYGNAVQVQVAEAVGRWTRDLLFEKVPTTR